MTMSVWEQRTSQLRRHRQTSSREVLHNNSSTGEDAKDGAAPPPPGLPGDPLSLPGTHTQSTPPGSLKHLASAGPSAAAATDPQASPNPPQVSGTDVPMQDAASSSDAVPDPPQDATPSAVAPEALEPSDAAPLPEPPAALVLPEPPLESEPLEERGKPGPDRSPLHRSRSPRLNGERRHRAVKKFRPPANGDTLTTEMAGHGALIRGRRVQAGGRGQGRSASRSVSQERRRRNGEEVEEEEEKDTRVEKLEESR